MKIPDHAGFFPALTFAVTLIEVVLLSLPSWYLYLILLLVFWGVAYLTRLWPDRILYLCSAGVLLVIALSFSSIWAGLVMAAILTAMILRSLNLLENSSDTKNFLMYCGMITVVAACLEFSNHVLLPLLLLGTVTAGLVVVHTIREFRFRRVYSGEGP